MQKMKEEFTKFLEVKRLEWSELREERLKLRSNFFTSLIYIIRL